MINFLSILLLLLGCFFALTGALGLLRMPDFYSRIHPAGKNDTLAQTLILLALFLQTMKEDSYGFPIGIKLLLISLFIFLTVPTATHAITKAAHLEGLKPWVKKDPSND